MILAFGCSVAHGAELVTSDQNLANTKFSYPNLIADALGVQCDNLAVCGNSNERIFHSVIEAVSLPKYLNVKTIIVGWTSTIRESWVVDGREWFFIPSWCATTATGRFNYFKEYTNVNVNLHPKLCADEEQYLKPLAQMYENFMKYKFDANVYEIKKMHYIDSIRRFCESRGIKLIETCCLGSVLDIQFNLDEFGTWRQGFGHPTKEDHKQIAQQILLTL